MLRQILIFVTFCSLTILQSCSSEDKFHYILRSDYGENLSKDTKIFFLGVEVGQINEVHFGKVEGSDYVFAEIEVKDNSFLNSKSYVQWSNNGMLEIVNQDLGSEIAENDTILMHNKIPTDNKFQTNQIIIKPLSETNMIDNEEIKNLTPEEKMKLDSLQEKIKKLNNLIQEVNDEN